MTYPKISHPCDRVNFAIERCQRARRFNDARHERRYEEARKVCAAHNLPMDTLCLHNWTMREGQVLAGAKFRAACLARDLLFWTTKAGYFNTDTIFRECLHRLGDRRVA